MMCVLRKFLETKFQFVKLAFGTMKMCFSGMEFEKLVQLLDHFTLFSSFYLGNLGKTKILFSFRCPRNFFTYDKIFWLNYIFIKWKIYFMNLII